MFYIKLLIVKFFIFIGKLTGRGSSLPGLVARKIKLNIKDIKLGDTKVIYVVGTNGKTTTTNLINKLLVDNNKKVITNSEGANLINGILTILLKNLKFNKTIDCDYVLLEVDENTIKNVVNQINPDYVVITNFFRDQLDRYGEIDIIVNEIKQQLSTTNSTIFINGNDPYVYYQFREFNNIKYYGIVSDSDTILDNQLPGNYNKVREIKYCPVCRQELSYQYFYYSHLGLFNCNNCQTNIDFNYKLINTKDGFSINDIKIDTTKQVPMYFMFNIISACSLLLDLNLDIKTISSVVNDFKFPPGRNQIFTYKGKDLYLNLVKNVVGFEETIDFITSHYDKYDVVICLNDNHADGRDISWIYDVNIDELIKKMDKLYCCGSRAYEMALRFEVNNFDNIEVIEDYKKCLDKSIIEGNKQKIVITNYTPLSGIVKYFKE